MKQVLAWLTARNMRLAVIVVPWTLAAIYLIAFAADRYVAESIIAVRQNGEAGISVDGLASLFAGSAPASNEDELMLEAHILSMDMLEQLDERLDLRAAFSAPRRDFFFRLPQDASREKLLRYYRERIEVFFDDRSRLLRVRTQSFSPELARKLNEEVIAISERFINESSHRLARDQMAFAETELAKANERVNKIRTSILDFQNKHDLLDPMLQAQANSGLTAELQASLARQEAELKGLLGFLHEGAPQVKALQLQIDGTRAQLQIESRRGTSAVGGTRLNALAAEYQQLQAEAQFAQDNYKLALTALESARIESTRKLKSLVLVESPSLPESAEYPRRLYTLCALLLALGLLYGIARLVVATIEDHQE